MSAAHSMDPYFSGQKLYGDDFGPEALKAWYEAEQAGYAGLDFDDARRPVYHYHALNERTGFRWLPADRRFEQALGVGSAFAEEFEPLKHRIGALAVLDPSPSFERTEVHGIPVRYQTPAVSGRMPYGDGQFDLVTCFGVLHHIANVSTVVAEIARVTRSGGYVLIREPITSMGDWREPRPGLTRNERGIPLPVFRDIVAASGMHVRAEQLTTFGPLGKLARTIGIDTFNSRVWTAIDSALCRLSAGNTRYHRATARQKFGPVAVAYVLQRP